MSLRCDGGILGTIRAVWNQKWPSPASTPWLCPGAVWEHPSPCRLLIGQGRKWLGRLWPEVWPWVAVWFGVSTATDSPGLESESVRSGRWSPPSNSLLDISKTSPTMCSLGRSTATATKQARAMCFKKQNAADV